MVTSNHHLSQSVSVVDVFSFFICFLFKTIDALDQWEDLTDLGKDTPFL